MIRRVVLGRDPMYADGPTRWGAPGRCPGEAPQVEDVDPDQDRRVPEGEVILEEEGQPVDGCDRQIGDLHRLGPVEMDRGGCGVLGVLRRRLGPSYPPSAEQDHQRPTEPDQQLVAPGHVGQRQRPVLSRRPGFGELLPGFHGEHEVDRVFGKDGDEGEQGQRQTGGDVELDHLSRPGEDEGCAHDRHSEEEGAENGLGMSAGDPENHPGDGHYRG